MRDIPRARANGHAHAWPVDWGIEQNRQWDQQDESRVRAETAVLDVERELVGMLLEDCGIVLETPELGLGFLEDAASAHLRPAHFRMARAEQVYAAMLEIGRTGRTPDEWRLYSLVREQDPTFSIADLQEFKTRHGYPLDPEAARERLTDLISEVQNAARWRETRRIASALTSLSGTQEIPASEALERAARRLQELAQEGSIDTLARAGMEALVGRYRVQVATWRAAPFELRGTTTGLRCLDDITHGMRRGDLWVLGARMSMGKTSMLLNLALAAARSCTDGHAVAIFSLEMDQEALLHRMAAMLAGLDMEAVEQGDPAVDWEAHEEALDELSILPLHVLDAGVATNRVGGARGVMDPAEIARLTRALHQRGTLDLVAIDYLELVSPPAEMEHENYDLRLGEIARQLKHLAQELQVPVLLLAQLNRENARSASKIPTLEGLRYSDGPAMHGDVVVFPVNWDYYRSRGQEDVLPDDVKNLPRGVTNLFVGKHRRGRVGRLWAYFEPRSQRYLDWDERGQRALDYHGNVVPVIVEQGTGGFTRR